MFVLQIEHPVPTYDGWKQAFDDDPIDRKASGVKRYRIYRPTTDSNYVVVDLEFDDVLKAESTLAALHKLWANVQGRIMMDPVTRILQIEESVEVG